ncbi:hypothetical protein [Actinomadura opuntiae]|uniref:hypothetical protein n=1 Tax=Actinomadura sp. OS1-43 TaxID=604315 RepID=UPI00255AF466|nr:hypothetical protein [Actinomadura sp. OS1-43]MDL4815972.1 hypothetical protein [Actinomadura sp. OS1-43]
MTETQADKVRENRLRRMANRQGYALKKSGRRDPRAVDYGVYWVIDPNTNALLTDEKGLSLDEIERWLTSDR